MHVRPAVSRDVEAVLAVAGPACCDDDRATDISDRIGAGQMIVAEDDGVLVGYALAVIIDVIPDMFVQENSGFLADIYVDDAFRRKGVGRALVDAVKVWLLENSIRTFEWYVAEHNTVGKRFWESVGGRRVMVRMRAETE